MKNLSERIHRLLAADFSLGNKSEPTDHAVVVTNPEFPLVPEANLVHSVRLQAGQSAGDLLREVEPKLSAVSTPWRHVVEDPFTRPEDLGALLAKAGYTARRRVGAAYLAAPEGEPHPRVEVRGIAEKSAWARFSELRREIQAAEGRSGQELEQYTALARRRSLSSNVRFFLAMVEFEPVGHVGLLSVGRSGMIVDLAVRPDHRGKGVARAMIARMVELSRGLGHDLTCTVHDDRPEPTRLLESMGFRPSTHFVSHLARQGSAAALPPDPLPEV